MVVFTCNNCGDSLQKPKVAKHFQFGCRHKPVDLTCVDCHKDFRGDEYVKHTKCITEDERYGAKGFTLKPSANKGERKQLAWLNIVQNLLNTSTNLSAAERNILNTLSRHENIPRKKAKFLNFIRSVLGQRCNMSVIETLWTKMEDSFKESAGNNQPQSEKKSSSQNAEVDQSAEENVSENQNNENISRENENDVKDDENEDNQSTETVTQKKKKNKAKKRALESNDIQQEEPEVKKKSKKEKKKETEADASESQENEERSQFLWKTVVKELVTEKGEISLDELREKVVAQYLSHCSNGIVKKKAISRFDKKVKKMSEIKILDEKVTLS